MRLPAIVRKRGAQPFQDESGTPQPNRKGCGGGRSGFLRRSAALLSPVVLTLSLALALAPRARADYDWNQIDLDNAVLQKTTKASGFQGSISLGYLGTTGNIQSTSLNGKILIGYRVKRWRTDLDLRMIQADTNRVLTDQSREATSQTDYDFSAHNYSFLYLDYLNAPFSGYDRRYTEVVGYGRRLISVTDQSLDAEIGVGGRQSQPTTGVSRSSTIERAALDYHWKISKNSSFLEGLSVAHGVFNTYSESETSLILHLAGNFALSVSYTISHNSNVPVGFVKTNTETSVSLIYSFN
ncbi:hypothetical protein B1B_10705 [mine drainage metagenome]|uniref:DUF481 domain-containing protein n=2 Tax=mine drainage metagenome TaxID=410659 RepID=T0ZW54_9ZZZZ